MTLIIGRTMTQVIALLTVTSVTVLATQNDTTTTPSITSIGCTCTYTDILCTDLGLWNTVPPIFANLTVDGVSYQSLTISGRTKLLSIQARAFSGSTFQNLQLGRLGLRSIDPSAFTGLANVVNIHLNGNGIGRIESQTFNVTQITGYGAINLIDISGNEIDFISNSSFVGRINAINLSANRLRQLPDSVLSNVSSLTSLNLSSNRLSNLSLNVFFVLRSIVNLTISRNSITYIDQNAFRSLSSLQRLDLSENLITSLDGVKFSTTLTYLNLRGNRVEMFSWPSSWSYYSSINELRVDRNKLNNLTDVSICTTNVVLKSLSITGNRIQRIPDNYFTGCHQLSTLDLSVNNITGVGPSTFTGLQYLVHLDASTNNIDELPLGSLAELKQLQVLNLADNRLSMLVPELFDNCTVLKTVILARNRLRNISSGVFNRLSQLTTLDISSNSIYQLSDGSFSGLTNLRQLNLSHNLLALIQSSVFYILPALTDLDLSANQLFNSSLAALNFSSPSSLKLLNLNDNKFTVSVCEFSLGYNAMIKLNGNLITKIDIFNAVLSGGSGSVGLNGNQIAAIAPISFSNSRHITSLDLSNNSLTSIDNETFVGLTELRLLDLSDNHLTIIQDGSFRSVPQLKELRLARNKFTVISTTTFDGLGDSLLVLDISDNNLGDRFFVETDLTRLAQLQDFVADGIGVFKINGSVLPLSTLATLSMRRNYVTGIFGGHSTTLKRLDLGGNRIGTEFVRADLPNFELLETLILDHNLIDHVNGNQSFPYSLTLIDLSNNQLTSAALQDAFQVTYLLQHLSLNGNQIQSLNGIGLESSKRSLIALSVVGNQLGDESWAVLSQLQSLQELRLDNNQLTTIPASNLSTMFDLQILSLSNNRFTRLDELTLDGLERSCTSLNLSHNVISFVNPSALNRLSNLNVIDLSSNQISSLVFPPTLDSLRDLRLDSNQLVAFPDGPMQFRLIRTFTMSGNRFTVIPELEIYNSADADGFVWTIDFSSNRLNRVDLLRPVGSFLSIHVERNFLSNGNGSLHKAVFDRVVHIVELSLALNQLGDVFLSATGLVNRLATAVSVLHLNDNLLTTLSSFQTLSMATTSITKLSLIWNHISVIDDTFFPSISGSLVELDLRANRLRSLNESAFPIRTSNNRLERLLLSFNSLRCDCSLVWLRGGSIGPMAEDAVCWTPQPTAGEFAVCYDIPAVCNISLSALNISDEVNGPGGWCDNYVNINGLYFNTSLNIGTWMNENTSRFIKHFQIDLAFDASEEHTGAPIVYDVSPLFGPVAGGTNITITGRNMNLATSSVALYPVDDLHYDVIKLNESIVARYAVININQFTTSIYNQVCGKGNGKNSDSLVAVTPDVSTKQPVDEQRKHLAVNVIFDGGPTVFTKEYFDFRPNANITGISPTDHLVSGGTLVTVTGTDVDCATVPKIQITVVIHRFPNPTDPSRSTPSSAYEPRLTSTEDCTINVTNTAITCRMPPVPLEWLNHTDAINRGTNGTAPIAQAGSGVRPLVGPNHRDTASIYVGMIFDGFQGYHNLSSSFPLVQFNFFRPPKIDNLDVIDFNPRQQTHINILGDNLIFGVQLADYFVTVGTEQCVLKDLTSNVLRCQPPFVEPPLNGSTHPFCKRLNMVMVRIGFEWHFCACIRYVDDPPNIGLIVGLTVGLGLPFIVIVIVVIVVVVKFCRRVKKNDNNGRQRAPPDAETRQYYYDFQLPGDLNELVGESQDYDTQLPGDLNELVGVRQDYDTQMPGNLNELVDERSDTSNGHKTQLHNDCSKWMLQELSGNEYAFLERTEITTSGNDDQHTMNADDGAGPIRSPTQKLGRHPFENVYELERKTSSDDGTSVVHRTTLITSEEADVVAGHPIDIHSFTRLTSLYPPPNVTCLEDEDEDDNDTVSADSDDRQTVDTFIME